MSRFRNSPSLRIWMLITAVLGATMAIWSVLPPATWASGHVTWWMLLPAFFVVEVAVVHIQFRREAYSFSLAEIPFLVGLVYASAADLLVAQVLGTALALLIHRRQNPLKLAFNVVNFASNTTLALLAFRILQTADSVQDWRSWPALDAATVVAGILNVSLITMAIRVSEGSRRRQGGKHERTDVAKTVYVAFFGLVVAGTNTSLALSGILVIDTQPAAFVLLASVAVTLLIAYRAYANERHHHESLEYLYESTRAMHHSSEWEDAIRTLLANACAAFRADIAELVLFPENDDAPTVRSTYTASTDTFDALVTLPDADAVVVRDLANRTTQASIVKNERSNRTDRAYFDTRRFSSGLVTRLQGEKRTVGLLSVAERTSDVTGFSTADLRLFETIAANAALSLENDQLEQSIAQLTQLEAKLSHQAYHDALTGLVNRRRFSDLVAQCLDEGGEPSVLFIDLDDFKAVNDGLGHAAGDLLLTTIAARIQHCLRANDVPARLGGDEFAVLIEGSVEEAHQVGMRLIDTIREPVVIEGDLARVGASIGLAAATPGMSIDELLRSADTAMYVAKSEGKGNIRLFADDMFDVIADRRKMQTDLDRAIENDELLVHLQPIIDLETGQPVSAEALVRWQHPTRGLLAAGQFIELAEQTGQTIRIGTLVLREALASLRTFHEAGHRIAVTVNVSGRQLADSSITTDIASVLQSSDIDPRLLIVEITETAVTADITANLDRLHALRALGVTLALDDFGTGHSSLGHLRQFPIDILKIAKEFVDHLGQDQRDDLFVKAIIDLGHVLGMTVIAEGIEHAHQAETLRLLACDQGQGFLYAKALPTGELLSMLDRLRTEIPANHAT